MDMTPINSSSFSIGTTICVRAPASSAESGLCCSSAASSVWTNFLVRNTRARGTPGRGFELLVQQRVHQSRRRTEHHLRDERTIDVAEQHAKLGLADTKGVLQDGGEDGLEPAGRGRDDAQHLRGRGLLF